MVLKVSDAPIFRSISEDKRKPILLPKRVLCFNGVSRFGQIDWKKNLHQRLASVSSSTYEESE